MYENINVAMSNVHIKLMAKYADVFKELLNRGYDIFANEINEDANPNYENAFEAYRCDEFGELTVKLHLSAVYIYGKVKNSKDKEFDVSMPCHTPDEVLRYAVDTAMPSDPRGTLTRIKCIMESKKFMDNHPDMTKLDVFRRIHEESSLFDIPMDDILATYEEKFCK